MEKLKALFGDEALTFEQLQEKLKDNEEVKLANLASGGYVAKTKHQDTVDALSAAENTIKELRGTVAKFDGVDVEGLKKQTADLEEKYNTDMAAVKLDGAVNLGLVQAKVKNPKLAKAALDMSIIKLDGDKVIGLSEQLDKLKETDGYLFEEVTKEPGPSFQTGGSHTGSGILDPITAALMKGAGLETSKGE